MPKCNSNVQKQIQRQDLNLLHILLKISGLTHLIKCFNVNDEGSCYVFPTRNNYCKFLASYGVIFQSVIKLHSFALHTKISQLIVHRFSGTYVSEDL